MILWHCEEEALVASPYLSGYLYSARPVFMWCRYEDVCCYCSCGYVELLFYTPFSLLMIAWASFLADAGFCPVISRSDTTTFSFHASPFT